MRRAWLITALLAIVAFVFWHTGGRADTVCERERFVPADGLSLWPPGARCTWGEPASSGVLLNLWFFATLLVPALALVVVAAVREHRRGAIER